MLWLYIRGDHKLCCRIRLGSLNLLFLLHCLLLVCQLDFTIRKLTAFIMFSLLIYSMNVVCVMCAFVQYLCAPKRVFAVNYSLAFFLFLSFSHHSIAKFTTWRNFGSTEDSFPLDRNCFFSRSRTKRRQKQKISAINKSFFQSGADTRKSYKKKNGMKRRKKRKEKSYKIQSKWMRSTRVIFLKTYLSLLPLLCKFEFIGLFPLFPCCVWMCFISDENGKNVKDSTFVQSKNLFAE